MWIGIVGINISSPQNLVLPRISPFFSAEEFSNISLHKYNQKMQHKNVLFIQEFSNWQFKHVQLLRFTENIYECNFWSFYSILSFTLKLLPKWYLKSVMFLSRRHCFFLHFIIFTIDECCHVTIRQLYSVSILFSICWSAFHCHDFC